MMEILYPLGEAKEAAGGSLTAMIHCVVAREKRDAFVAAINERLEAFNALPGSLGSHLFEQEEGDRVRLTIMKRFASQADHEAWLASDDFREWRENVTAAQVPSEAVRRYYGLETLFTPKKEDSPPQWKMAVVLTLAAFPGSYGLSKWFGDALAGSPPLVGAMITSPVMVVLMTYVMVPLLTRIFSGWLQPK